MTTLVVVESPAKAKTIAGYLGKGYDVTASFGHVRDLPERADEIPAAVKKEKWAKLGVNVDHDFEPLYVIPDDKKKHVDALKKAAKQASALLLATDEDREGESISWHITQILKPKKSVSIKRIVFHEITPEAIKEALANPRDIYEPLVRAQETRRILDRLYGYTLSPVLWKKVAPKLSAGRVQSVAVRLLVDREKERAAFKTSTYWDLSAKLATQKNEEIEVRLTHQDDKRLATGKSFDSTTGLFVDKDTVLLDENGAKTLAAAALAAKPWTVSSIETRPDTERPPVPFMTSTLQQEANRRLRFSAKRTMQIAQQLYEGIDLGDAGSAERVGLITYMRTDSLTLSERALAQAREVISQLYGKEYLPDEAVRYKTKSRNAQEAHEAIRPTDLSRKPEDLRRHLDADQMRLYELIWKRTLACQMVAAKIQRTQLQIEVSVNQKTLRFSASGKQIVFPGFLRAYVEGSDDPDAELDSRETILPALSEGQTLDAREVIPLSHTTKPPARLTEATLVKRLEEAGVGRPSTYASIISTIQDRGYCFKHGSELVPTFVAFAVTDLLEKHFGELLDFDFTAKMEDELDEIADGKRDHIDHLAAFYRGTKARPGLVKRVESETPNIAFPAIKLGEDPESREPVVVRVGRYGTFVQRGEGGKGNTASLPDDTLPAELTLEKALELIRKKGQGPTVVGSDPKSGREVLLCAGRFGAYLEVKQTDEEAESGEKPRRVGVPQDIQGPPSSADIDSLLSFPRTLGKNPDNGEEIVVHLGRYGAYVRCGKETRNVGAWRDGVAIDLDKAVALLRAPKAPRGRQTIVRVPLREWTENVEKPIKIFDGRYGLYATDGETNANLPRGADVQAFTLDEALALLRERAGKSRPKKRRRKASSPRKSRTKQASARHSHPPDAG